VVIFDQIDDKELSGFEYIILNAKVKAGDLIKGSELDILD